MPQSMNDTTLCHDITYNIIQSLCIIYIWLLSRFRYLILTYSDGSLRWGINFIFHQKHNFGYRSSKILVTIMRICNTNWLRWQSCSFNITMSPTSKFLLLSFHFCLVCKLCRNYFLHLYQNYAARVSIFF